MDFYRIKKISKELYGPSFSLERIIPHSVRKYLELIFRIFFIISFLGALLLYGSKHLLHVDYFSAFSLRVNAVTELLFVLWAIWFLLEAFYYSHYYIDKKSIKSTFIDFDLAFIISKLSQDDIISGFFHSVWGDLVLLRCGIPVGDFKKFMAERNLFLNADDFKCQTTDNVINLRDFLLSIHDLDKPFRDFLFKYGIQKEELSGIAEWIIEINFLYRDSERWWSQDNLLSIPSLGQDWSYGQIYNLKQYERPLSFGSGKHYRIRTSYGQKEQKELEAVLLRSVGANVILVGNDEAGKLHIISDLWDRIFEGTVLSELKHKRVILLDDDLMIARNGQKSQFEFEFLKVMNQAVSAGNIILVIEDFPGFIASASTLGVDLPSLLEPFLLSKNLQVIALSDTERFHRTLERNAVLSQHFENILIKEIDNTNSIKVIENEIMSFERRGLFFTYPAVVSIVLGAERYFPDGIMPDKAIDLLQEIVPKLESLGKHLVEKEDILTLLETKTGIPMGEVSGKERNKLLNLEELLQKRIVGQDEAVVAISNAVRRARSGINNPNKPLGSFLFLGPTGVGKTETTKALADVFFDDSTNILRLDMSEYSGADSVSKLIGSFEGREAGVLSTMIREHPYGVLLLDEFEKTTKDVMNLFLQVLDEGFFSDMAGKKINARNLIIIATSNAGSELIWEAIKAGEDLSSYKDTIIDTLIKNGTFKPELLNRFDGVILFHPLDESNLRKIAKLMLDRLHNRLADRGIDLVVDDKLINFVMGFGSDPKFGARPMDRAIEEKVEEIIAEKIIKGSLEKGSSVVLNEEDFGQITSVK